jgi:hypothetical protein
MHFVDGMITGVDQDMLGLHLMDSVRGMSDWHTIYESYACQMRCIE